MMLIQYHNLVINDGDKHLVVVYRELENDGFIITAFLMSKIKALNRRTQLWPN